MQIILNRNGKINVIYFHWIYGIHIIRRAGKAVKNYNKQKYVYHSFLDYLKGACYGDPNSMNGFSSSYENNFNNYDNNEACRINNTSKMFFKTLLNQQQNCNGFLYLEFNDKNKIDKYCFIGKDYENGYNHIKPLTADEYLDSKEWFREDYNEDWTKQIRKDIENGIKTFDSLTIVEPINIIKRIEQL